MGTIMKYILVTIGIMFIIPFTVKADCSYEREAELSRIAANVQFSYTYTVDENGEPIFTVNINNLTNDIYVKDSTGSGLFQPVISGTGEKKLSYAAGSSVTFDIYSNDSSCYGEKLSSMYVNLPQFNYYSTNEECQKYPDFKYCQVWLNTSITPTQFQNELTQYQGQIDDQTNTIKKQSIWVILKDFWNDNKVLIILVISCLIFILGYVIYRFIKSRK